MKLALFVLPLFVMLFAFAEDISSTETYSQSYIQLKDGSSHYIGKCSTHEVSKFLL